MLIRISLFFTFFLMSFIGLFGQANKLEYSLKLTISDGLAHNGVTSILEDSKGFLWFGTFDGINRYDGYKLKTYKNTIDNNILSNNRVRSLSEDFNENLWIGTEKGITVFNYSQEKFMKIKLDELENKTFSGPIIKQILPNEELKNVLCLTERNGILIFNENYNFSGQYYPKELSIKDRIIFFNGLQLNKSDYLFTTSSGLFLFNLNSKKFKRILYEKINYCSSIIKIHNNKLLVTLIEGLAILEFQNKQDDYSFKLSDILLTNMKFRNSMLDASGNLWLGTLNDGIIQIENGNLGGDYQRIFNNGLKVLRASSIIKTSKNKCWVGTFNEGVFEFDIKKNPFESYNAKMNLTFGLSSNYANHIAPLDMSRAYLSSPLGGMALFNTINKKFEPLDSKVLSKFSNEITAIFIDSKNNVWFRVYNSSNLYRIPNNSSNYDIVRLSENPNLSENLSLIRSFTEDKYGNIWVATNSDIYKIITTESVLKVETLNNNPFFFNNKLSQARYIYSDPIYDFIWIGTDSDGLFRIENENNSPIEEYKIRQFVKTENNFFSLTSNFVTSIIRLPNKDLWVGTEGGGVCKVIDSNIEPQFIPYTEKNGLSNNVVKNILFDNESNLWISTNNGLNKLNIVDNSIRKFNKSDGLPFDDFWFEAQKLKNGVLILSGLDGFCYFNPKDIQKSESLPNIEFENLKIFNKVIEPGDTLGKRVILNKRIADLEEIELKYNENIFSIDVLSLHFSNPINHAIKYRMLPINNEWIEVPSNQNTIDYRGLQPGKYELSVMASNSLNDWTKPKTLKITISPPFWKTNVAYIIYILLIGLSIYLINRNTLKIQALKHKVEIEQIETNNIKESNESKLRFFSNISHEIKTPLSLITAPTNLLLERYKKNPIMGEQLSLISRQSNKILQLIEQVQDFKRSDAELLEMNYSRFNLNSFIKDLVKDFNFFATNDQKSLEIIGEEFPIVVSADKDKLEKIFNNLLNNAFKYTNTNDTITIEYKSDGKDLIVFVKDTGRGIDEIDLSHIFERFYQSHKKQNVHLSGSGIGLAFSKRLVEMHYGFIEAESELNVGTTITVKLPIVKELLENEKLINKKINLPTEKEITVNNKLLIEGRQNDIKVSQDLSEILVFYAEDNIEMRKFVTDLLSKYFKVKSFRNGQECYRALELEWPDIVISDIQMPELNGLDLCIKIKSDLKTSHIPVILLTALSNIEDHLQGIRDGADAYIKKPFNVHQLITNTEALLTNRKQLRERYQVGIPLTKDNKNNRNDNAFLDKLYSLMEENLDNQDFDLNSIAKELYLNRTHFFQKVKTLTNQTPFEILRNYRLKKAAEFLVQKNLSVNEVYAMVGFKSRTHFSKIFKDKYGVSASKYKGQ